MTILATGYEIRPLQDQELTGCYSLGDSFFEEGSLPGSIDRVVCLENWQKVISNGMGVILGGFDGDELCGIISGLIYPDFNDGILIASEMFWYVRPDKRSTGVGMELFRNFESWGKDNGAKRILMVHLKDLMDERLKRLYLSMGYRELETHYVKEV